MTTRATIKDTDHGYAATMKGLDEAGKLRITIGIHEEEGGASDGAGGLSVAEVASINEFGEGNVPARPTITRFADDKGPEFVRKMRDAIAEAIRAKGSPAAALDALAQVGAGEIQAMISAGVPPPNAQSTIDRKGSSTPLINTGQFRSSIVGKVASGAK